MKGEKEKGVSNCNGDGAGRRQDRGENVRKASQKR